MERNITKVGPINAGVFYRNRHLSFPLDVLALAQLTCKQNVGFSDCSLVPQKSAECTVVVESSKMRFLFHGIYFSFSSEYRTQMRI